MIDGKTFGRRMIKTFILDTSWFRPLIQKETDKIIYLIENYTENDKLTKKVFIGILVSRK